MATNARDTSSSGTVEFVFYMYKPSMVAAVTFIVLFSVSAIWQAIVLVRRRAWYFIPFLIGCLFEVVGYIGRAMSSTQSPNFTEGPYVMQSTLILLGPVLFAASIYMTLARLIIFLDAGNYSVIRPHWLTKFFVMGDMLSFFAQGAGGGMMASAKDSAGVKRGENIILGGLGIQILFFGFFILAIVLFHIRIAKRPTPTCYSTRAPWKMLLLVLYATSGLILIRNFYRVVEYAQGYTGSLQSSEKWIYIFDATLMFIVTALFDWFHPSKVLSKEYKGVERVSSSDGMIDSYSMEDGRTPKSLQQDYAYAGQGSSR